MKMELDFHSISFNWMKQIFGK